MEGTACITKIVKERHEEPVTVYNLGVKDWVSYFVGKVRVYVHNVNGYKSGNKSVDDLINDLKDTTNMLLSHLMLNNKLTDSQKWHLIYDIAEGRLNDVTKIANILKGK